MSDTPRVPGVDYIRANDPKYKAKSPDPGWKYGYWPDDNIDRVTCILCGNVNRGGVSRLKKHLIGGYDDVTKCPNTTSEIAKEMREWNASKRKMNPVADSIDAEDDSDAITDITRDANVTNPQDAAPIPSSGTNSKRKKAAYMFQKSKPRDQKSSKSVISMLAKSPEQIVDERHAKCPTQTTIEAQMRTPEEKERVHKYIADFFYENGISFNVVNSRSYEVMVEAIGQFGPGLKPPNFHDLRTSLLDKSVKDTDALRKNHEAAWKKYGCTLMSDGWTDKRQRHLINFLVNSPEGTYFMGSVDASGEIHNAHMLASLLDTQIKEIGVEHVVQIVTDNDANYKAAGKLLMEKYNTLYWTPCAAHCLDLMLEDIGKMDDFKKTIEEARMVTTFIYRHGRVLDALRKLSRRDLVKTGVTRFATAFLTLQSLYRQKDFLHQLVNAEEWTRSSVAKTDNGKKIKQIITSSDFWRQVGEYIQASQPLLGALRVVDGDEKPALPELYATMELAKRKIQHALDKKPILLAKVMTNITRRWDNQMGHALYGAGLLLNPRKYYDVQAADDAFASRLRADFNEVLEKLVTDRDLRNKISHSADAYQHLRGEFAKEMAKDNRKTKSPIAWWDAYGGRDHDLLKFARRIVSLCCSSSGCERNWSTFEFIHTKKRNKLEHKRLNDLVYVQYNHKIASRFKKRRELGKDFDPLVLEDLQWSNEWINVEAEDMDVGIEDFTTFLDDEYVDDDYGLINPSATEGDGPAQSDVNHDFELDDFA